MRNPNRDPITSTWIEEAAMNRLRIYCATNHIVMIDAVTDAVNEYISRNTHADLSHTRAASDPISGDGVHR